MVSDAALLRYKRLIATLRDRTSVVLVAAWAELERYDEDVIADFEERTRPTWAGAKAAAVAASSGFFALALGIRPVAVPAAEVPTEPDTRTPFTVVWHALAMARPFEEAVLAGRSAVSAAGYDFVQSTARRTGDVVAERSNRSVRWRRVPGGQSCAWCRTVAGQFYQSAESADFGHERCDCDAVPA